MVTPAVQKILVTLVVLLALGGLIYTLYTREPDLANLPTDLISTDTAGQEILNLADKLDSITIDQTFFASTLFTKLIDFGVPLIPESQGRPNPFAPIGADFGGVVTVASKVSTTTKAVR